jgi:nitroimidazol reductase NimA-like FMN-containing flavoprotein (pyridoxamine 5'-phosphate oxidase superfamily)
MRELRRKDKEIGRDEAIELLTACEYGVLSTIDKYGQPYGIPLNYVYKKNCIYFHCALSGHKLDNMQDNPGVSFCVVGDATVLPSAFSTSYTSAIAFGAAAEVQGRERYNALVWLLEKYSPGYMEEGRKYIEKMDTATRVIKIELQQITGKRSPARLQAS